MLVYSRFDARLISNIYHEGQETSTGSNLFDAESLPNKRHFLKSKRLYNDKSTSRKIFEGPIIAYAGLTFATETSCTCTRSGRGSTSLCPSSSQQTCTIERRRSRHYREPVEVVAIFYGTYGGINTIYSQTGTSSMGLLDHEGAIFVGEMCKYGEASLGSRSMLGAPGYCASSGSKIIPTTDNSTQEDFDTRSNFKTRTTGF